MIWIPFFSFRLGLITKCNGFFYMTKIGEELRRAAWKPRTWLGKYLFNSVDMPIFYFFGRFMGLLINTKNLCNCFIKGSKMWRRKVWCSGKWGALQLCCGICEWSAQPLCFSPTTFEPQSSKRRRIWFSWSTSLLNTSIRSNGLKP